MSDNGKAAPPCVMVIFGASGDLAQRKLLPALYHMEKRGLLPRGFAVIGMSRESLTDEAYRARVSEKAKKFLQPGEIDPDVWKRFLARLHYHPGHGDDPVAHKSLAQEFERISREVGSDGSGLFYLAVPPALFGPITQRLGEVGLTHEKAREKDGAWRRVVYEKPFGNDFESALALDREIGKVLTEDQIYRIDHYLGKETVQNILVFRFSNGVFEPVWNRRYIDSVQITVAETLGVEGRGSYYESAGALRDMVPSHLFQLLSMIAMEPPASFGPEDVRDEKLKVLKAIKPFTPETVIRDAVRGQYGEGWSGGQPVSGYRQEPKVSPSSNVETYSAVRFFIDNWRWANVPFYVRTGKRLQERVTEVAVQFREVPFQLFRQTQVRDLAPNHLVIQIQPQETISLHFAAKVPGTVVDIAEAKMEFDYKKEFGAIQSTGYETLIYDCMNGDPTLFQRADHVACSWAVIQPILDVWGALKPRRFPNYAAGSWGPREADELLARDGRAWRVGASPVARPLQELGKEAG